MRNPISYLVTWFLFMTFFISLIVLIWSVVSQGAPAPLTRRPVYCYGIPNSCVMDWRGQKYDTTFTPGGHYQAVSVCSGKTYWTGTWDLRYDKDGPILTIRESYGQTLKESFCEYVVRMSPCLRQSVDGYVKLETKR